MNRTKYLLFPFFLICSLLSCNDDYSAAAKNICACTPTLVQLNEQMEVLKRDGKIEELTQLMGKAGEAFEDAVKCAKKNELKNIDKPSLENALLQSCDMNEQMAKSLVEKL